MSPVELAVAEFRRLHAATSLSELGPPSHRAADLTPWWSGHTARPSSRRDSSSRTFSHQPIEPAELLDLLSELAPAGESRSWPSAGSLYRVSVLALSSGTAPLISTAGGRPYVVGPDVPAGGWLDDLLYGQLDGAYWALVLCAEPEPYAQKYAGRGYRYALLEAGHLAQELLLLATRAGKAACPVGAFDDRLIGPALAAAAGAAVALYVVAIGNADE